MFTMDNTEGFTSEEIDLLNTAVEALMADGVDEKNACDIVNNNWSDGVNTVETLTRR